MPCYDSRDNEPKIIYRNSPDPYLIKENKWLEAGLCAIITELEKRGIANEVISQASKSGLINLMDFWAMHQKNDEARLALALHKFSEHEQDVLRKLLNKDK